MKQGMTHGLSSNEVQEVPLRHQSQESAMRGKMSEVRDRQGIAPDLARKFAHLLMGELQEIVQNAEFMHDLKSGRVNCVTAEVTQEIRVFFKHVHIHARSGEKIPQ